MTIKNFIFSPFMENTYVLHDETNEAVIIDAGCLTDKERNSLSNYLKDNNLRLKRLLNTHLHLDHQFGNRYVYQTYGIKPEAAREDEFFLQSYVSQCQSFGLQINEEAQDLGGYIVDEQEIKFGNSLLKAIHVPGHSPGGTTFYSEKENVLFSGDTLFCGSIGRTDLPGGNYSELIESITRKLLSLPDSTVVYCGHGSPTTIENEKKNNPYL